jgi:beta-galactosidase
VEQLDARLTPSGLHITVQPASLTTATGALVTFDAAAAGGTAPLSVQWYENTGTGWTQLSGQTRDTLELTAPATHTTELFQARFVSGTEKANSSVAVLTSDVPPGEVTDPANATVNAGQVVTFKASAKAEPNATVQWQLSTNGGTTWTPIVGATSDTLAFVATGLDDGNEYRAVFTNGGGSATTSHATLTVNSRPVIASQPVSQVVAGDESVTLSVAAQGAPHTYTYQWYVSTDGGSKFTAITGATSASYVYTAPDTAGKVEFRVTVTNKNGTTTSSAAAVTVVAPAWAVDAGGPATGVFAADKGFSGGTIYSTTAAINTSRLTNPPPQAVFQTERYGNFTYTASGLTPGARYTVDLLFAEIYWNSAGQRLFNVTINGTKVLTDFDIFATAGGKDIGIVESFTATAQADGTIAIGFISVKNNAKVSGIEIFPAT